MNLCVIPSNINYCRAKENRQKKKKEDDETEKKDK